MWCRPLSLKVCGCPCWGMHNATWQHLGSSCWGWAKPILCPYLTHSLYKFSMSFAFFVCLFRPSVCQNQCRGMLFPIMRQKQGEHPFSSHRASTRRIQSSLNPNETVNFMVKKCRNRHILSFSWGIEEKKIKKLRAVKHIFVYLRLPFQTAKGSR